MGTSRRFCWVEDVRRPSENMEGPNLNKYIVNYERIIQRDLVGTTYFAMERSSNRTVAVKIFEKKKLLKKKKLEQAIQEREILLLLNSNKCRTVPFFVQLYIAFQDSENLYFVLSPAHNGSLLHFLNKVGTFDNACTKFYAAEILHALEHLHNLGIMHRNLKIENILLSYNMHIRIADFGSGKILKQSKANLQLRRMRSSFVESAHNISSEMLTDNVECMHSSDLWSFGAIVYQMIEGLPPFQYNSEYLIFKNMKNLYYTFSKGFCSCAEDVVRKLLEVNPLERLSPEDTQKYLSIRSHPFFSGIEFDALYKQIPPTRKYTRPPRNDHVKPSGKFEGKFTMEEESQPKASINLPHPVVKQGTVLYKKYLVSKRKLLILTEGPHLYYADPETGILRKEIPWTSELRVEAKNFKVFLIHTPKKTFHFKDESGYALTWCATIERFFNDNSQHCKIEKKIVSRFFFNKFIHSLIAYKSDHK